ncbi:MAG: beta-lactamase family protein [Deltaproteobacteria bacterium]|nr:beta-lactamase family protein [Deltaproteobacteria bacterium]
MRVLAASLLTLVACSTSQTTNGTAPAKSNEPGPEEVTADTPKTTVAGNTFIAPAGWRIVTKGQATILEAPERGSRIAFVDVQAQDAEAALALAWSAYGLGKQWPVKVANDSPDRDGWSKIRRYEYLTSPNEKRDVTAGVRYSNGTWTVTIYDVELAVGEKRGAQVRLVFGRLMPKGYQRESFAGKQAHPLDASRIAELGKFVETAQRGLGVPGVSVGLLQDGRVVFAGGYGVRELGKPALVDAETKYIIASNTKGLTTLMLGKLVDEKKMTWETPATSLYPAFKLGDADTTSRVLVKHLICACTGLPRQDMEWLLQFQGVTPEDAMATLGTMQPTTKFGELFQYSNPLAAAAGFIGGRVAFPNLALGKGYDEVMRTRVFDPLGMKATTFDYGAAQQGNYAAAHAPNIDGEATRAIMAINYAVIPVRPAGGAWSTVQDMLKYVQMELASGKLPDGKQYMSSETLLARRAPQVALGKDELYGMGLMVDTKYDVTVVHHGGDMIGYHSDMMWLPEHGIGAVVLTNGDPGWLIRTLFRRKLLEVLFDGRAEADNEIAAAGKTFFQVMSAERKLLTVPADAAEVGKLAASYANAALGEITVRSEGGATMFDFGEWKSEMASRKNPDGTVSFVTIAPGINGLELLVGSGAKSTLVLRDAQHEYVFEGK